MLSRETYRALTRMHKENPGRLVLATRIDGQAAQFPLGDYIGTVRARVSAYTSVVDAYGGEWEIRIG